jgi:hypothetical protein
MQRVGEQPAGRWRRPREVGRHRLGTTVHQVRKDGQAADPVDEDVMHHDDERAAAAGQAADQRCGPQRPRHRQPVGGQRADQLEQGTFVPRRRAADAVHMPPDVEPGVVNPERAATSHRRANQALPQPGHGPDPHGDGVAHVGQIRPVRTAEQ